MQDSLYVQYVDELQARAYALLEAVPDVDILGLKSASGPEIGKPSTSPVRLTAPSEPSSPDSNSEDEMIGKVRPGFGGLGRHQPGKKMRGKAGSIGKRLLKESVNGANGHPVGETEAGRTQEGGESILTVDTDAAPTAPGPNATGENQPGSPLTTLAIGTAVREGPASLATDASSQPTETGTEKHSPASTGKDGASQLEKASTQAGLGGAAKEGSGAEHIQRGHVLASGTTQKAETMALPRFSSHAGSCTPQAGSTLGCEPAQREATDGREKDDLSREGGEIVNLDDQGATDGVEERWPYEEWLQATLMQRMERLAGRAAARHVPFAEQPALIRTPDGMSRYLDEAGRRGFGALGEHSSGAAETGGSGDVKEGAFLPELDFVVDCVPEVAYATGGSGLSAEPELSKPEGVGKRALEGESESVPQRPLKRAKQGAVSNWSEDGVRVVLRQVVAKLSAREGFEGMKRGALEVLADLLGTHIRRLGRTLRMLEERYGTRSQEQLLQMCLNSFGVR
jgi:hypothetical protein